MNNEIKVNLSVALRGRTMLSEEMAESLEKQNSAGYDKFSMKISNPDGKNSEVIHVKTRKSRTVNQSLNISKEGYNAMIDSSNPPYWIKPRTWSGLSIKLRLEAHLQRICESLDGISYTYQIFED